MIVLKIVLKSLESRLALGDLGLGGLQYLTYIEMHFESLWFNIAMLIRYYLELLYSIVVHGTCYEYERNPEVHYIVGFLIAFSRTSCQVTESTSWTPPSVGGFV